MSSKSQRFQKKLKNENVPNAANQLKYNQNSKNSFFAKNAKKITTFSATIQITKKTKAFSAQAAKKKSQVSKQKP
jgi:hypothetical protein